MRSRSVPSVVVGLLVLLAVPASTAVPVPASTPASAQRSRVASVRVLLPPPAGAADYQLGGAYPAPTGVRIVSRDRSERPAAGAYGICYLNAFQSQAADRQWWRTHHRELLLHDAAGREVTDPGWPGEMLLDTRSRARRVALAGIVGAWIDGCARSGFDAVEPDNLDSWTRSRGLLHRADAIDFARLLTARAHARGLAVAQKNAADLSTRGPSIGFDFAVAEECQVYDECSAYTAAYGRRVIEIEYSDQGRRFFTAACRLRGGRASIVYRDRELTRPGTAGYVYAGC